MAWHSRGCVCDKFASEWAVGEDWIERRSIHTSKVDTRDFRGRCPYERDTFSRAHTKNGQHIRSDKERKNNCWLTRLTKQSR